MPDFYHGANLSEPAHCHFDSTLLFDFDLSRPSFAWRMSGGCRVHEEPLGSGCSRKVLSCISLGHCVLPAVLGAAEEPGLVFSPVSRISQLFGFVGWDKWQLLELLSIQGSKGGCSWGLGSHRGKWIAASVLRRHLSPSVDTLLCLLEIIDCFNSSSGWGFSCFSCRNLPPFRHKCFCINWTVVLTLETLQVLENLKLFSRTWLYPYVQM